jgi:hypothetical protein
MEPRLVIGLFLSSGIAEDALDRLKTEGVPSSDLALAVLKPVAPYCPLRSLNSRHCRSTR